MTPRLVRILVAIRAAAFVALLALGGPPLGAQSPTAKLQGNVRDSAGQPVPAARVTVVGTAFEARTDSSGYYFINSILSGRYDVEAHASGHKPTRTTGVRMRAGYTVTLDIKLLTAAPETSGAALQGFVRDSAGRPMANARVVVVGTALVAVANAAGCYRIENIPAGAATVRGSFVGYAPVTVQDVALSQGTTTQLDLRLVAVPVRISVSSNAFETAEINTRNPAPRFGSATRSTSTPCQ
jgi:protocatechuate 3,4-dioxygenase beta subunit